MQQKPDRCLVGSCGCCCRRLGARGASERGPRPGEAIAPRAGSRQFCILVVSEWCKLIWVWMQELRVAAVESARRPPHAYARAFAAFGGGFGGTSKSLFCPSPQLPLPLRVQMPSRLSLTSTRVPFRSRSACFSLGCVPVPHKRLTSASLAGCGSQIDPDREQAVRSGGRRQHWRHFDLYSVALMVCVWRCRGSVLELSAPAAQHRRGRKVSTSLLVV